jgi:hypothetical protein
MIVGPDVSVTVTVNVVGVALFPWMSVDVQVTVVDPGGNTPEPNVWPPGPEHDTGSEPSTTLVAVGVELQLPTTAPPPVFAATVMSDGVMVIVGGTSAIVTLNVVGVALFPLLSVDVHVTVVEPTGNTPEPLV